MYYDNKNLLFYRLSSCFNLSFAVFSTEAKLIHFWCTGPYTKLHIHKKKSLKERQYHKTLITRYLAIVWCKTAHSLIWHSPHLCLAYTQHNSDQFILRTYLNFRKKWTTEVSYQLKTQSPWSCDYQDDAIIKRMRPSGRRDHLDNGTIRTMRS